MQKWTLKPLQRSGRVELCGMDLIGGAHLFQSLKFLGPGLDRGRFREALAKTVEQHPLLAGRLVKDSQRLFIDLDAPGVSFEYQELDRPCPRYGVDAYPFVLDDLYPQHQITADVTSAPLYAARLTRFSDGLYAYACNESHLVKDASGGAVIMQDLQKSYAGEPTSPAVFHRGELIANGSGGQAGPSAVSGISMAPIASLDMAKAFITPKLGSVTITPEQREQLVNAARRLGVSFNHLLHALMFRTFALTSPRTAEPLHANIAIDLRYIKGLNLPQRYLGNAVLQRSLPMSWEEAAESDWSALCKRFADPRLSALDGIAQDIDFYQRCYEQGEYTDTGALTNALSPVMNGGFFVNNATTWSYSLGSLGGLAEWAELILLGSIGIRMGLAFVVDPEGTIVVRLVLPEQQLARYKSCWRERVASLISN